MDRYFLHLRHPNLRIEDPEGEELDSLESAIQAAAESARELLIQQLRDRKSADGEGSSVEVADDKGNVLGVVEFKDVMNGRF
jgi:hypothetical protein